MFVQIGEEKDEFGVDYGKAGRDFVSADFSGNGLRAHRSGKN